MASKSTFHSQKTRSKMSSGGSNLPHNGTALLSSWTQPGPQPTNSNCSPMQWATLATAPTGTVNGSASLASTRSIEWKELYAVVMACETWGQHWSGKCLLFHCDNEAVVHIWESGRSRCPDLMDLVRALFFVAAQELTTPLPMLFLVCSCQGFVPSLPTRTPSHHPPLQS